MDAPVDHMASELYNLIFEDRSAYLFACVQASVIGLDIAVQYINETMAHLRQCEASRLLFVRQTPAMVSVKQYAMVGSVIVNMIPKDVRVALVDHSPAHEIVVGVINTEAKQKSRDIRAFDDFAEAEAWLLENVERSV